MNVKHEAAASQDFLDILDVLISNSEFQKSLAGKTKDVSILFYFLGVSPQRAHK